MCGKLQTALIFQSLFLCAVIMQSSNSALGHVLQRNHSNKLCMIPKWIRTLCTLSMKRIKAEKTKQSSLKIYLYKHIDMVVPKDHMAQFKDVYLTEDHSHIPVNDTWVKF